MKPHRVPRQIDVDQGVTTFLKINSFTACLCGHKESHATLVEQIRGIFPCLMQTTSIAGRVNDVIGSVITVDERHGTIAEAANQLRHEQGLCRLVFREEEYGTICKA